MIKLSGELRQAVNESKTKIVHLVDPETNVEYVLLPVEKFAEILKESYEDGPLTFEEKRRLLVQAGIRAGWDDPEMDVYNKLDPRRDNEDSLSGTSDP